MKYDYDPDMDLGSKLVMLDDGIDIITKEDLDEYDRMMKRYENSNDEDKTKKKGGKMNYSKKIKNKVDDKQITLDEIDLGVLDDEKDNSDISKELKDDLGITEDALEALEHARLEEDRAWKEMKNGGEEYSTYEDLVEEGITYDNLPSDINIPDEVLNRLYDESMGSGDESEDDELEDEGIEL